MGVNLRTVRAIRVSKGFNQKRAAAIIGTSGTSYGKKERGEVEFTANELGILAKSCMVSPARFYEEL